MLDADLAILYGVSTKRLNEQVRRNRSRFPDDFMFQLTREEVRSLRSQIATSKQGRGGRRVYPACLHGARDCDVIDGSQ
jgi:ORF6N domain